MEFLSASHMNIFLASEVDERELDSFSRDVQDSIESCMGHTVSSVLSPEIRFVCSMLFYSAALLGSAGCTPGQSFASLELLQTSPVSGSQGNIRYNCMKAAGSLRLAIVYAALPYLGSRLPVFARALQGIHYPVQKNSMNDFLNFHLRMSTCVCIYFPKISSMRIKSPLTNPVHTPVCIYFILA
jgi:hypothetical protein